MHISLDKALDRQKSTRQVGDSLQTIAPGPAAAYSLRSLTGGDPKVVRVRRESDNDEQDFTAAEVSSGALVDYVNRQAIKPLDVRELASGSTDDGRTGNFVIAKAAYSLRSLGDRQATVAATNDTVARADGKYVVQVRRNVDGTIKSFTADEVTDGTLVSFVNESFTSSLPLDVQGSAAAAYSLRELSSSYSGASVISSGDTAGDTTSNYVVQVRRSSDNTIKSFRADSITNGDLLTFVNEDVITEQSDFTSGVDSYATSSHGTVSREASFEGKSDVLKYEFASTGRFGIRKNDTALDLTSSYTISFEYYADSEYNGKFWGIESSFASRASASSNSPTVVSGAWTSVTLNVPSGRTAGINYFSVRLQDASSDTNGLTGITANVRFKNIVVTQTTGSGFVATWYDQSGNSNHATQGTADSQPKIVSDGSLVSLGVDFTDGKSMDFTSISAKTVVAVNQLTSTSGFNYLIGKSPDDDGVRTSSGDGLFSGADTATTGNVDDFNGAGGTTHMNGSQSSFLATSKNVYYGTATSGFALRSLSTAFAPSGTSRAWKGKIAEVIIYTTDQSENRRAIEESIATNYSITLGSFSRNGHVKTWYDQSVTDEGGGTATGNHAVQATADEQPKVVIDGSLVTGGIDFDGTDDNLVLSSTLGITSEASHFAVANHTGGSADTLFDNRDNTTDGYRIMTERPSTTTVLNFDWLDSDAQIDTVSGEGLYYLNKTSSEVQSGVNGGTLATSSESGSISVTAIPKIGSRSFSTIINLWLGTINELIVYGSDQTDNRGAFEANIASHYGITAIPTAADPPTVNGFVETWYDQSGNGNDATQTTATKQPKIVNSGSLLTDGIDFDGTNDVLETSLIPPNAATLIGVANWDVLNSTQLIVGARDSTNQRSYLGMQSSNVSVLGNQNSTLTGGSISAGANFVLFGVHDVGKRLISTNGTVVSNTDGVASNNTNQGYIIGGLNNAGTAASFLNGKIAEVIVYASDQSSKRTDLETNINSHYSIF